MHAFENFNEKVKHFEQADANADTYIVVTAIALPVLPYWQAKNTTIFQ